MYASQAGLPEGRPKRFPGTNPFAVLSEQIIDKKLLGE
jgi:hypothetical protein